MKKVIKSAAVLQDSHEFSEKIPFSVDLENVDISENLKVALEAESISLDQQNIDDVLIKMLKHYPRKLILKEVELKVEQWKGEEFPYTYVIDGLTDITSTKQLVIVCNKMGLTETQLDAFAEASITAKDQLIGEIILQAREIPSENLPIVIIIGGEVNDN